MGSWSRARVLVELKMSSRCIIVGEARNQDTKIQRNSNQPTSIDSAILPSRNPNLRTHTQWTPQAHLLIKTLISRSSRIGTSRNCSNLLSMRVRRLRFSNVSFCFPFPSARAAFSLSPTPAYLRSVSVTSSLPVRWEQDYERGFMANDYENAADNECNSGPFPNRYLLEEMRYWHDSKREAGEE
jgi:hypothetical protein